MRRALLLVLAPLLLRVVPAAAQNAAAIPTYLYTLDPGHPATSVAVSLDMVYVLDASVPEVRQFTILGTPVRRWGSAGSGNGQFSNPTAIACDADGNVYVADTANNRIQVFTPSGTYDGQWGTWGSLNGQLIEPRGIAIQDGIEYVSDSGNNRIQRFVGGQFLTAFGSLGSGPGQFNSPRGVVIDATGNIYVADNRNHRIEKFTSTGTFMLSWGDGPMIQVGDAQGLALDQAGNVYLANGIDSGVQKFTDSGVNVALWGTNGSPILRAPFGVACDTRGNVYVADPHGVYVYRSPMSMPGVSLLQWGSFGNGDGQFTYPNGIVRNAAGSVFVVDSSNNRIQIFGDNGTYLGQFGSAGTGNGQFAHPTGIAADPSGNVYVTDTANNRVQKFDHTGGYVAQWGSAGSGNGQFSSPAGVTLDRAGHVYVVDSGNNRVEKFAGEGTFLLAFSGGFSGFSNPSGIATDPDGNVYVTDTGNDRVQKFTDAGEFVRIWGVPGANSGQFLTPTGIAVDSAGFVYVCDTNNDRVQEFWNTGTFITQWGGPGSLTDQLYEPTWIALDPAGNVYVTETGSERVQKFAIPALIEAISDVGNDQGRSARVRFARSSADAPGSGVPITGYEVYRQIVPGAVPARANVAMFAGGDGARPADTQLAGWEEVGSIPAHGETEYNIVVPTLKDATGPTGSLANFAKLTTFMVRSDTADPYTFFDSAPNVGWSEDNLPPPVPAPFLAAFTAGATHLHWGESPAGDFAQFHLYRGTDPSFVPGTTTLVTATTDTGYADAGPAGSWYKLSALDLSGNESAFAIVGPNGTTAVSVDLPREVELAGAMPNPVRAGGVVRYALPCAAEVRLTLLDVSGREVRQLATGIQPAGWHSVPWSGLGAGGHSIGAGVYFLRLSTGGRAVTRRVIALE